MSEIEETVKRIQAHRGVTGVSILNCEGITIRSTLDHGTAVQYASLINVLTNKVRNMVRDLDPQNDVTFLRVRTKKHEIMIAPDKDYTMVVIQKPDTR